MRGSFPWALLVRCAAVAYIGRAVTWAISVWGEGCCSVGRAGAVCCVLIGGGMNTCITIRECVFIDILYEYIYVCICIPMRVYVLDRARPVSWLLSSNIFQVVVRRVCLRP